ncbi:DMT family transporter [Aquabacterium sp.]|uniref:DMT family transporter n=1 Tax=Aquabacterium sp. TaxID=1872578 RepID=UPI002488E0A2|nr:DMT family transporter [Aquabacterium sp.]MDI1260222.1 DMT family transporter [Aquabacterium sp.]
MKARDLLEMLLLAAIWGASFLFLRMAAPVVGPVAVAALRVTGAALLLLPVLMLRGDLARLKPWLPALMVSALLAYVLPFLGLSQAARSLPAGLLSILNATTPLWGALVGWWWAGERLSAGRLLGLAIGIGGVALLAADRSQIGSGAAWPAVALCLASTLMYALAVHHAKRYLSGLSAVSVSAGSLGCAALMLALPAWWLGPQPVQGPALRWEQVPAATWGAALGLAVLCTALAYWMFYRLIARVGPTKALTVTFLIPVFGMLWGHLFLNEQVSASMMASTTVIVLGTLLSSGVWTPRSLVAPSRS